MKTIVSTFLISVAVGLAAFTITGCHSAAPQPPTAVRPPPIPLVLALDANHDGIIDANEIAGATATLLALDLNGDGKLTIDEYLPPARTDGMRLRLPPIVYALDTNGDGVIDANEIANAPAELRTLDKLGDGRLTMDEVMGPPITPEENATLNRRAPFNTPPPVGGGGNNPMFGSPAGFGGH